MTIPPPDPPHIPPPDEDPDQGRARLEFSLFEDRDYEADTQRQWDRRIFAIKLDYLNTFSRLGRWAVRLVGGFMLIVVLYMIGLVVIHYTIPQWDWLSTEELGRLESIYGRAAGVGAPIMLISNAWIIWWMSRTRRGA